MEKIYALDNTKKAVPSGEKDIGKLKKEYSYLKKDYLNSKNIIKDQAKADLRELKDIYHIDKLKIEDPLKSEKYAAKVARKKAHRKINEAPKRALIEEIGNAVSHGIGALWGVAALVLMMLKCSTPLQYLAAGVYGACLVILMTISCLYHSFRYGTTVKRIFRRFDYSSIYLLIGGTFAPLLLVYWGNNLGIILFGVQWALIAFGITMIAVFGPGRLRWLHFTLYFVIGWVGGFLFLPDFVQNNINLLFWIIGGGLTYTLGMIPFAALRQKPVAHFIWHFFVLFGAIIQWVGIYLYVF